MYKINLLSLGNVRRRRGVVGYHVSYLYKKKSLANVILNVFMIMTWASPVVGQVALESLTFFTNSSKNSVFKTCLLSLVN